MILFILENERSSVKNSIRIYIMNAVKHVVTSEHLKIIYHTRIHPYLYYGNLLSDSAYKNHSKPLVILQKSYTHYSKVKYNNHTSPIFNKYNILKLPDIHNIQLGKLIHSITVATLPQPMFTIFTTNDDVHSYATRQKNYFHLPLTEFDYIMLSFLYRGPKHGSNCLNM